ncbi:MAG TPA: SRPBCC family protein [Jatrophihabitans sp.]|nr:SRPBCC family protein [Jatrophihabitans sp.]
MTKEPKLGRGRDRPMTTVSRRMAAPRERVFAAMSDAWLLPVWVVGATHIRRVDESWPARGAEVHHQVGAWPIMISDSTAVAECEPPRWLALQGRAFPFGEARIELTVEPDGADAAVVTLAEAPSHGPARVLDNPLLRWVLAARNRESLDRLAAIVENRRETSRR